MRRKRNLGMAAGSLMLLPLTGCQQANERQPNVLLILADDLGKEWIQQYGAEDIELPNLQRLADQSIVFDRAYSMAQSTPSRACILTGQYPFNNGWVNHFDVPGWNNGFHFDADRNPCFTKQVKAAGYRTCIAGKWQLNDFRVEPEIMTELGFDEYFMWTGAQGGTKEKISGARRYWDPYIHSKEGSRKYPGKFGPDLYSDFILDFMGTDREEPFFVYYPMALAHGPFVATPHHPEAKTIREKHVAMVEYMDFLVGKLLDRLEAEGLMESTYIIFTTDNGTSIDCYNKLNGQIVGGGKSHVSENGINCPFFVHVPGQKSSRKSDAIIDFTDIAPTILELTGSEREDYPMDGQSLVPIFEGRSQPADERYAFSLGARPAMIDAEGRGVNVKRFRDRVLIGEEYKIYLTCERSIDRIYKIQEDPFEQNNLLETAMEEAWKESGRLIEALPLKDKVFDYRYLPHDPAFDADTASLNQKARTISYANYKPVGSLQEYENFLKGIPNR